MRLTGDGLLVEGVLGQLRNRKEKQGKQVFRTCLSEINWRWVACRGCSRAIEEPKREARQAGVPHLSE